MECGDDCPDSLQIPAPRADVEDEKQGQLNTTDARGYILCSRADVTKRTGNLFLQTASDTTT